MPRDLFVDSLATRRAPKRSRWTILGSLIAHLAFVTAMLVIPVLSALDNFVLHANNQLSFVMPAVNVPQMPPPPRAAAQSAAPAINTTAAPIQSSDNPTTEVVTLPAGVSGSGVPDGLVIGATNAIPGAPQGTGVVALANPPPGPMAPIRPGGNVQPPARIAYTAPIYPTIAKSVHIEGNVIVEATIDESGAVRDVRILRSTNVLFDKAAIEAVSRWRYTPTRLNGMAVPILLTVTVTFSLR